MAWTRPRGRARRLLPIATHIDPVVVHILCAAPVPVGHRVELRVFLRDGGRRRGEPAFDEPLVTDLDTGVAYGADWHFQKVIGYRPGVVRPLPLETRSDLTVHAVVVGTVSAARVVTIGGGESSFLQTTLVVEPEV